MEEVAVWRTLVEVAVLRTLVEMTVWRTLVVEAVWWTLVEEDSLEHIGWGGSLEDIGWGGCLGDIGWGGSLEDIGWVSILEDTGWDGRTLKDCNFIGHWVKWQFLSQFIINPEMGRPEESEESRFRPKTTAQQSGATPLFHNSGDVEDVAETIVVLLLMTGHFLTISRSAVQPFSQNDGDTLRKMCNFLWLCYLYLMFHWKWYTCQVILIEWKTILLAVHSILLDTLTDDVTTYCSYMGQKFRPFPCIWRNLSSHRALHSVISQI